MKLIEVYRQFGWRIIPRAVKSLLRRIGIQVETFYLLQCSVDPERLSHQMSFCNYSDVMELKLEDVFQSPDFSDEKKQLFTERFESGQYSCYGIKDGSRLIYVTWISWKYMNYPAIFKKKDLLLSGEALLEDSYCHPDYRGRGFHSKMNLFRMKKILERGNEKVLALVLKENKPAFKVQLKSGFHELKKIRILRIGNRVEMKETVLND